jgi:hypothetical protein
MERLLFLLFKDLTGTVHGMTKRLGLSKKDLQIPDFGKSACSFNIILIEAFSKCIVQDGFENMGVQRKNGGWELNPL